MSLGVDFSFARLTAADLKQQGYTFAGRYLASSSGKRLSASEVTDFKANGIDLVLVWEDEATAALGGFNQGQHDAHLAQEQANNLGVPADIPIYLAVDFDINDAQKSVAAEYFKGAESVSSRFRAGYGGYYLIKYLFDKNLIDYGWQAVAWSGGQIDSRAQIYQNGNSAFNGQADIDEAKQANFGQWPLGGSNMAEITTEMVVALSLGTQGTQPQSPDEYSQWIGKTDQQSFDDMVTHYSQKGQARQAVLEKALADASIPVPTPAETPLPSTSSPDLTGPNQQKANIFIVIWKALFG
jgi:hypothetical protein